MKPNTEEPKGILWNIEGSKTNIPLLTNNELDTDIILLTETLATHDISCLLPGFYCYFAEAVKPQRGRPMGGLSICVSKSLDCRSTEFYRNENMLCVSLNLLTIIVCYYPPNTCVDDILLDICQFLDTVPTCAKTLLGGDFDCRIDGDHVRGEILCENLQFAGLHCINSPENCTFYSHNGSSTIDLFFAKNITATIPATQQMFQTKHQIVSCRVIFYAGKVDKKKQHALLFDPNTYEQHQLVMYDNLSESNNCNSHFLKLSYNISRPRKKRHSKPWFHRHCYQAHKTLKLQWYLTITVESSLGSYSQAKWSFKALCRKKRTAHEKDREETIIITAKADRSKFWSILCSKKRPNMPSQVQQDVCITHFEALFEGERDVSFPEEPSSCEYYDLDRPVSLPEVTQAISRQANNKAPGPDMIAGDFLKQIFGLLYLHIFTLFQVCFDSKAIPNAWRVSNLIPLYKGKGSKKDPDCYRDIALLNCIYKCYTSILHHRLATWCEQHGKIPGVQYGFRRSTIHAISILRENIDTSIATNGHLYACFIDFRKSFDSIDRSTLFQKLAKMGVSNNFLLVLHDILRHNMVHVVYDGYLSSPILHRLGLPQGGKLYPLLFSLFIADLAEIFVQCK